MVSGLHLEQVEIHGDGTRLLSVDASIAPGEVLTLMGPSGSGKSTLINAISGFLPHNFSCRGKMVLNDINITRLPPERRRIGVLFQDPLLFPHFSVLENIIYALQPGGSMKYRCAQALGLLEAVELKKFANRDPYTLSGGQKARVALVRVLASRPHALLLDEPFSKLDDELRSWVRQLVFAEVKKRNLPTLLVTHDQGDAEAAGGRILAFKSGNF